MTAEHVQITTTLSPDDRKYIGFLFSTMIGLISANTTAEKPLAPAKLIALMGDAATIEPIELPDDVQGAAMDFVEYGTHVPGQLAADRFHEVAPVPRPAWMPELQQFSELDLTGEDDDLDDDLTDADFNGGPEMIADDDDDDSDPSVEQ